MANSIVRKTIECQVPIGFDIRFLMNTLDFEYGCGAFGPKPEYRSLDAIRPSLRVFDSPGPDPVYAIAMDVGEIRDQPALQERMLLFGVVIYAQGRIGEEPVRSQGHVHKISPHCGWSTPELIEVFAGRAIVYLQEKSGDDPGRCFAIEANPGERVVIPPGWAHYIVNANEDSELVFGAWCDRQYGFDYTQVRAHRGLAWFPRLQNDGAIRWNQNLRYLRSPLVLKKARPYPELGIELEIPLYLYFRRAPEAIQWISNPSRLSQLWESFEP